MKTQVDVPMPREMGGSDAGVKAGQVAGLKTVYMVDVAVALVAVATVGLLGGQMVCVTGEWVAG